MRGGLRGFTSGRKAGSASEICGVPKRWGLRGKTALCRLTATRLRRRGGDGNWSPRKLSITYLVPSTPPHPAPLPHEPAGCQVKCASVLAAETRESNVFWIFLFFNPGWPRTQSSTLSTLFFLVGHVGTFLESQHSWD